jgi:hypothetical protein
MSELKSAVTGQELADFMMVAMIEIISTVEPDRKVADVKLEDLASNLLTMSHRLREGGNRRVATFVRTTAQQLIQTETGAGG